MRHDVEQTSRLSVGMREFRLDEGFKYCCEETKIHIGDAQCACQCLRGPRAAATLASGRRWEADGLLEQPAANLLAFEQPWHLSVACDGKRLGCPDDETLGIFYSEAQTNYSSFGAPQVPAYCVEMQTSIVP